MSVKDCCLMDKYINTLWFLLRVSFKLVEKSMLLMSILLEAVSGDISLHFNIFERNSFTIRFREVESLYGASALFFLVLLIFKFNFRFYKTGSIKPQVSRYQKL